MLIYGLQCTFPLCTVNCKNPVIYKQEKIQRYRSILFRKPNPFTVFDVA
jgi:hypothetical protein